MNDKTSNRHLSLVRVKGSISLCVGSIFMIITLYGPNTLNNYSFIGVGVTGIYLWFIRCEKCKERGVLGKIGNIMPDIRFFIKKKCPTCELERY